MKVLALFGISGLMSLVSSEVTARLYAWRRLPARASTKRATRRAECLWSSCEKRAE